MPLATGSNHGASRADSDLLVGLTRELLQRGWPVIHLHGDNLCSPDRPVRAEDVIGRVLTVNRDGREQPLDGPGRLVRLRRIARWLFAASIALATVMAASEASAQTPAF